MEGFPGLAPVLTNPALCNSFHHTITLTRSSGGVPFCERCKPSVGSPSLGALPLVSFWLGSQLGGVGFTAGRVLGSQLGGVGFTAATLMGVLGSQRLPNWGAGVMIL